MNTSMKTIALIENGVVANVIDTGPEGWPGGIDISGASPRPGIGWTYAEGTGFTAPTAAELPEPGPEPEPAPANRIITNLAFDLRFSDAERIAIEIASLDNPAADMEQRAIAAALRVSKERSNKARFTDLDDATTRAGVEQMEAIGLLAEGRAVAILDAPVLDGERP